MLGRRGSSRLRAWRGAASGRCVGGDGGETEAVARKGAEMTLGDAAVALGLLRSRLRFRSRPHAAASSSVFASRLQAPAATCGCESCRSSPEGSTAQSCRFFQSIFTLDFQDIFNQFCVESTRLKLK